MDLVGIERCIPKGIRDKVDMRSSAAAARVPNSDRTIIDSVSLRLHDRTVIRTGARVEVLTHTDEQELLRLTGILESLHDRLTDEPSAKEAVQKAALALSVSFIHGLRSEVEGLYATLDKPLPATEWAQLRQLGIDPDVETG